MVLRIFYTLQKRHINVMILKFSSQLLLITYNYIKKKISTQPPLLSSFCYLWPSGFPDKEKQLEGVVAFLQRMVQAVHDLGKTLDIESSRSHLLHRFHDITSQLEQEQHMINQLKKHFMCSVSSASHASEVTSDVSIRALTTSSSLSSCTAANASNNSSLPQINLDEEMEQPRTSLLESLVQEAIGSGSRDRRGSIDQVDGYREGDQNEDRIQNRWSMNQSQSRQHVNSTNRSNQEMADPRHQETLEQETVDVGAAENSISSEDEEYLPNYRTSVRHLSPEVTESHGSYSSDTSDGLSDSFASSDDSEYTPINSSLETDDDISDSFTVTSYSFDSPLSEITDDSNSGSHGEDHNRGSEHLASENESSVAEISRPPQGAAVSESHIYSYGSPHLEEEVVVRDGEYLQDDIDQENDNHGISSSGQAVSHVHPQEAGVCLSTCAMFRLRNVLYKPDHGNSIASSSLFHDGQSHTVDKQEGPCYSQELCTGQSNVDLSMDSQMQIEIKEHQTGSKNNLSHLQDTSNIHDTYQINVVINSDSTSLSAEDEHDDNKEMPNSFAQTSDHSSHGSDTIEQPACSSLYAGGCCQITGQFENNSAYAGVRVQDAGTGNDVGAAETEAVTEELSTNVPDDRSSTWHRSRFRDIYTSSDTESDDSRCRRMPRNILSVAGGNTENANSLAPKCQQSLLRKNNLTVITQEAGSSANASPERPCSKRKSACILQEPESKHPRVERKMCSDGGSTERNGVSLVTDTRAVHRKHSHRLSSSTRCTSTACVVSGSTLLSINSSVSAASASLPNPPPWARPNHMTGMAAAASGQTSSNLTPVHGSVASRTRSNCRGLSMQASVTQQPRYSRQTIATSVGSASANGRGLVHIPDIPVPPNTYQLLTAYAEDDETDSTWTPTGSSQSESD